MCVYVYVFVTGEQGNRQIAYCVTTSFLGQIMTITSLPNCRWLHPSVLCYCGWETWSLSKQQQSRVHVTQMNALRRIEEVSKMDRARNVDNMKTLQQESTLGMVESRQEKWKSRMQEKCIYVQDNQDD